MTVKNDATEALLPGFGYGYDLAGNRTSATYNGAGPIWTANAQNQLEGTTAGGGVTRVTGTVSKPSTVKVNGQAVPVSSNGGGPLTWETMLYLASGANQFPVEATETNPTPGFNAQKTTRTLRIDSAAATYGYDANGSLTGDGGVRSFEWDAANRLVAINYTGSSKRTEFSYDGLNRRVRTIERDGATVLNDRRLVWDSLVEYEERDSATNAVLKRFYPQGYLTRANASDPFTAYLTTSDHLGSVREVVDEAGTVHARYDYDPYGVRTKLSGDLEADFGYTGHSYHVASGLHMAPYRAYDAALVP